MKSFIKSCYRNAVFVADKTVANVAHTEPLPDWSNLVFVGIGIVFFVVAIVINFS